MARPPLEILVTHPGRQHSHQAALALHGAGALAGYWSGVPAREGQSRWLPRRAWSRYSPVPLPRQVLRAAAWTPALRRVGALSPSRTLARWADFAACRAFDRWGARRLSTVRVDAVIACEISALSTFREARARGIATLLDAPSIHHTAQDRLHGTDDSHRLHARIAAVKDVEVELADHILTVSALARDTYVEAGADPARVHALPLGADLELFSPAPVRTPGRGCVFVFCGATIRRKGFDLLVAAFERVLRTHPDSTLRLLGPLTEEGAHLLAAVRSNVAVRGPRPQAAVAEELRSADCLVLPSRNDSYAMVVPEALASGIPVIVSSMVGAKELVDEGRNGWVVPIDDLEALSERMLWCAGHRDRLHAMQSDCRKAAERATWPAYRRRLVTLLEEILAR